MPSEVEGLVAAGTARDSGLGSLRSLHSVGMTVLAN